MNNTDTHKRYHYHRPHHHSTYHRVAVYSEKETTEASKS